MSTANASPSMDLRGANVNALFCSGARASVLGSHADLQRRKVALQLGLVAHGRELRVVLMLVFLLHGEQTARPTKNMPELTDERDPGTVRSGPGKHWHKSTPPIDPNAGARGPPTLSSCGAEESGLRRMIAYG